MNHYMWSNNVGQRAFERPKHFFMRFALSNTTKTSKSSNKSISNNYRISIIWVAYVFLVISDHDRFISNPAYQLSEMFPLYNSIAAFLTTSKPNLITLLHQICCPCFIVTSGLAQITSGLSI